MTFDFRNKKHWEMFMEKFSEKGFAIQNNLYQKYLKMDCSEKKLREIAEASYGKQPYENPWVVYSALKSIYGITHVWFEPQEYEKRMKVICKIAGV